MAVILVVEDEPHICEIIVEILGQLGHEARVAGTAADAVNLVKAERPDAILLDIVLPDGRGTTVLDRLRSLRPTFPSLWSRRTRTNTSRARR
jgi:CheY-like chemotaxis protein